MTRPRLVSYDSGMTAGDEHVNIYRAKTEFSRLIARVEAGSFDELTFESRHAEVLRKLPWHHRDPFDRMLIAQATAERLTVLTADPHFAAYGVELG